MHGMGSSRYVDASTYAGPPGASDALGLTNRSVERSDGVTTVRFTRPLSAGHHPIPLHEYDPYHQYMVLWAVGPVAGDGCAATPAYHTVGPVRSRGLRFVDWDDNEDVMGDWERCDALPPTPAIVV